MDNREQQSDRPWPAAVLTGIQQFATLPDCLLTATQPAAVSSVLTNSIPAFARGDMTLQACKVGGLRMSDATHVWIGTYQLTVETPATGQHQLISLQGTIFPPGQDHPDQVRTHDAFGAVGWRWYVPELRLELATPPPDPVLPVLPQLTDPATARSLLERSLRASAQPYRDLRMEACRPEVLRYHPGLRATVRYQLTYPAALSAGHDWPEVVVAKTYDGDKGQHAYDGMYALWQSPLATGNLVTIAEPIAYLPDIKVLIQGPIREEHTLKSLLDSVFQAQTPALMAELDAAMRTTAIALAVLHRTDIAIGSPYTWVDELAEVRAFAAHLATMIPELASAAAPLLATLEAHAAVTPSDPLVFAHGTFRPAQVLLYQGRIGFIDFDSWHRAEPALDLALFLTSIKDIGLSAQRAKAKHGTDASVDADTRLTSLIQLEALCDAFLAEYTAHVPISRPRVALWESLNIFSLVLRSWERVKPVRLDSTMLLLERHIQRHFA